MMATNNDKEKAPLSLVSLPSEILHECLKHLLPYQEDIVLQPRQYYYSTESLVPDETPVQATCPAVLATCRCLYDIGTEVLYSGNIYIVHFKASRQYRWPPRSPRHGMAFSLTPPRPHRSLRADGSYSGFDRLPRTQAWNLHRVKIEVYDNLERGFLELRDSFDTFAKAVAKSQKLKYLAINIEAKREEELDYSDAYVYAYDGDEVPRVAQWQTEQKIRYMLQPLVDLESLTSATITGSVDEKFAAKLAEVMMTTGGKIQRMMLHLKMPKLDWMKRHRTSVSKIGPMQNVADFGF